jgi:hypothetical protein
MALLTGTQLATALDLTYAADPFDQVAASAVAVVSLSHYGGGTGSRARSPEGSDARHRY